MSSEFEDTNLSCVSDGSNLSEVVAPSQNINNDLKSGFEHDDRNDIDADSTRSSSSFVSNPDMLYKEQFSPVASSFNEEESISRRVQDMDISIASLRETIGDIKLGDSSKNNTHSMIVDESFHNSTMDTTRYNETQAQFDRDLDFDQDVQDRNTTSPFRNKKTISPWKQLRSVSNAVPENMGEIPKLHFNQSNCFNDNTKQSLTHDTTAIAKINELNKQVTGYRIQIKLFKQFLQHLIDKTRYSNTENAFDISELNHFQNNLNGLSPLKSTGTQSGGINTEFEDNLSQNYDELLKLNEDLYLNLEDFQNKLHDKETQLNKTNIYMRDCSRMVNEILELLISDPTTDDSSRHGLTKCLDGTSGDNGSSKSLETKLYVIRLELRKKLETTHRSYPSPPPSNPEREQIELSGYITIIQGLITSLDKVQKEFLTHKQDTSRIQEELKNEVESTQTIRTNYESLYNKFNQLCKTLEMASPDNGDSEIQKLRIENQKLRTINNTVDNKFDEYQKVIDRLQQEVNDFQKHYNNSSAGETTEGIKSHNERLHNNDLLQSYNEISQLQEQLKDLTEQYKKLQVESSNTISTLSNQLNTKKQENSALSANQRVTDQLKNDLEIAVEKQRVLKAEKIRLSYSLESLANDKVSLQTTIRSLTDKISSLTVEVPQHRKDEMNEGLEKLNVLGYQLNDLLLRDIHEFQKFLKSFIKIADDSSLKEPKRKIDTLAKKITQERNSQSNDQLMLWNISELNTIREYHKSVFDYFARAVDIIVNDHVKLLLKESEHTSQTSEYVNKLHKRIDELNSVNDDLTRQLDSYYTDDTHDTTQNASITSPGSKMRIAELTNRWKAEREARVYENQEAQKRLKELDRENARLRQELDQVS